MFFIFLIFLLSVLSCTLCWKCTFLVMTGCLGIQQPESRCSCLILKGISSDLYLIINGFTFEEMLAISVKFRSKDILHTWDMMLVAGKGRGTQSCFRFLCLVRPFVSHLFCLQESVGRSLLSCCHMESPVRGTKWQVTLPSKH